MTSWRNAKKLRAVDGVCHICKEPADGKQVFQTRFCDKCLRKGMDQEPGVRSEFALIPVLYKIQTTYADVVTDIDRAIHSLLPPAQKARPSRDKKLEEGCWPCSSSLSNDHLVPTPEVESSSVDTVPLPSMEAKIRDVRKVSG